MLCFNVIVFLYLPHKAEAISYINCNNVCHCTWATLLFCLPITETAWYSPLTDNEPVDSSINHFCQLHGKFQGTRGLTQWILGLINYHLGMH